MRNSYNLSAPTYPWRRGLQVGNYYVAAGMNSSGIASAAGAGKAVSQWIMNGSPTMDLWPVDIRRFSPLQNNKRFLRDRCSETLGLHYTVPYPRTELQSCRGIRRSPLYDQLQLQSAQFGSKFGWERPNYFMDSETQASNLPQYSMGVNKERPSWFAAVGREHRACRESAAIFDQTSFGKISVMVRDWRLSSTLGGSTLHVHLPLSLLILHLEALLWLLRLPYP